MKNCPNCGAVSTIEALEINGCPYCKTVFKGHELFPKVANYYSFDGGSASIERRKEKMKVYGFIFGLLCVIPVVIFAEGVVLKLVGSVFAFGAGYLIGMIIYCFTFLGKMIIKSSSNFDLVMKAGTKKFLDENMKKIDTNFSYEYFESKILNLVKIILFDDDRNLLPQNKVQSLDSSFDNLVDITYRQVIELSSLVIDNGYVIVQMVIYLENDYFNKKKIKCVREALLVEMRHNMNFKVDMEYILSAVRCEGCGSSFDATHKSYCPYCGAEYHAENDDWIVTSIKRL